MVVPANTYKLGEIGERPWGSWEVIASGEGFTVKKITVKQGHMLSLQRHQHRSEHWIIVQGKATVTIDEHVFQASVDDKIYISKQAKHRIGNEQEEDLCFIEVQIGDFLDESDIERFEDNYGRVTSAAT